VKHVRRPNPGPEIKKKSGLGKPTLSWARCPEVLLTLTRAFCDKVHRPCVLEHQGLVLFLIVGDTLSLPRVLLPIVPKGGVVLQLGVHRLGLRWVLRIVLLLETVSE
jgi:hypothetical protein